MLTKTSPIVESATDLGEALEQATQIISILEEENKRLTSALSNLSYTSDIFDLDTDK